MNALKYREMELKYRADDLTLEAFKAFCTTNPYPVKVVTAAGYDHFYSNPKDPKAFARHRVGPDMNQLTFKRKTSDKNNFLRTEHNIDLATTVAPSQVKALLSEFGYEANASIFKNVFVYHYGNHNWVYYVCYDSRLKELGRFVEIEMAEDYNWPTETAAWDELTRLEAAGKAIGLSPQRRMKNSLYEMFKDS